MFLLIAVTSCVNNKVFKIEYKKIVFYLKRFSTWIFPKKKCYAQNYRKEWERYEEFKKWLKPVPSDSTKAYFSYCPSELYARITDLKKYTETTKRKTQTMLISQNKVLSFSSKEVNTCRDCAKAECLLALYIAEHSSIRQVDHLTDICKKCFKYSKSTVDMKLHQTKCTQIIKDILAPHFESELRNDIANSFILDESTDVTTTKYLGIVVRYFSAKQSCFSVFSITIAW